MKKLSIFAVAVSVLFLVFYAEAFSQGGMGRGSGGWSMGSQYVRLYDVKTVETVKGEVVSVEQFSHRGMSPGIHLTLRTDKETVPVHLGPQWFLERLDTEIKAKDSVEVKGSRVTFDGKPAIIAAEVKKGEETLVLRDESGVPVWADGGGVKEAVKHRR